MATRIERYVPLAQAFSGRSALLHEAVAARLGLHGTDVKVLRLLGDRGETPSRLAASLGLTNAALTTAVDRLEAAGFVTRVRDGEDRRKVTVCPVPERIRDLDQLYAGQKARMTELLDRYTDDEFAVIEDFLTRASEVLAAETRALREP